MQLVILLRCCKNTTIKFAYVIMSLIGRIILCNMEFLIFYFIFFVLSCSVLSRCLQHLKLLKFSSSCSWAQSCSNASIEISRYGCHAHIARVVKLGYIAFQGAAKITPHSSNPKEVVLCQLSFPSMVPDIMQDNLVVLCLRSLKGELLAITLWKMGAAVKELGYN